MNSCLFAQAFVTSLKGSEKTAREARKSDAYESMPERYILFHRKHPLSKVSEPFLLGKTLCPTERRGAKDVQTSDTAQC